MAYGYRFWLGLKDGCILGSAESCKFLSMALCCFADGIWTSDQAQKMASEQAQNKLSGWDFEMALCWALQKADQAQMMVSGHAWRCLLAKMVSGLALEKAPDQNQKTVSGWAWKMLAEGFWLGLEVGF